MYALTQVAILTDEPKAPVTLKKQRFISLAPSSRPNTSMIHENEASSSPSRLWSRDPDESCRHIDRLSLPLIDYSEHTEPAEYYKALQSTQPEVLFSTSQAPFRCNRFLSCWARMRCICICGLVVVTNDDNSFKPKSSRTPKPGPLLIRTTCRQDRFARSERQSRLSVLSFGISWKCLFRDFTKSKH